MKIIIVNKYYYIDGGPERYMFSLMDYLKSKGHEVVPFSIGYPKNMVSEYNSYFLKPAGGGSETKLGKLEGGALAKLKIAARSVYSFEAKAALDKLIRDVKPDLVYCLNIVNHLSPSIIDAARRHKIPVVMRLSDYYLVCPSYLFLRKGKVCKECETGAYYRALRDKCVYGSFTATLCRVAGMYIHKYMGIYNKVAGFVTTTNFMRDTLIRAGFKPQKIHHIPTFVNASRWTPQYENDGYVLYFGRLTPEKGIEFLLDAYQNSQITDPLYIVGDGPAEYVDQLKSGVREDKTANIRFLGKQSGKELQDIVYAAKYVVVPSLWYDNAPNVVYESFAAGKPVIASALGGLCEQVTEDTGILVEPGNTTELAEAMVRLSKDESLVKTFGENARRRVEEVNSIETHVDHLLELFNSVMEEQK